MNNTGVSGNTIDQEADRLLKQLLAVQALSNKFRLCVFVPDWANEIKNRQGGYIEIVHLLLELELLNEFLFNRSYRGFVSSEYQEHLKKRRQEIYGNLFELAHLVSE